LMQRGRSIFKVDERLEEEKSRSMAW